MAGLEWTYGQVRNYVQGSGCTKSNDRIAVMMIACLQELWTKVCDDPFYAETVTATLLEGEAVVDVSQCATITEIKVNYLDDNEEERCRKLSPLSNIPERYCGCPPDGADTCDHEVKGLPSQFEIVGDDLTLIPCPDREVQVEIKCFRDLNCILFEVDDDGVVVWNNVDLPPDYVPLLANLVLSKSYAEDGDFASSTFWKQTVSAGLDSLLDKRANRYNATADNATEGAKAEFKIIRRGETRGCSDPCCSCREPEIQQVLIEKVYVDCDGLPIIEDEPVVEQAGKA